jgi:hypothetical protein
MLALGLRRFHVKLWRGPPAEFGPLVGRYARMLAGLNDRSI